MDEIGAKDFDVLCLFESERKEKDICEMNNVNVSFCSDVDKLHVSQGVGLILNYSAKCHIKKYEFVSPGKKSEKGRIPNDLIKKECDIKLQLANCMNETPYAGLVASKG